MNNLHIYLLAGVQTKDSAFITLNNKLNQLLEAKGMTATIEMLYPYGDYRRKLWKQLFDICIDFNVVGNGAGIGGKRLSNKLVEAVQRGGDKFLFIGHSGGGVAAYQLARYLHYNHQISLQQLRVIQIGSPKMRVSPLFKRSIAYIHATDEQGKIKDPIAKIGYWGGLQTEERKSVRWNQQKYAPSIVQAVPLIGGHADYFRVNEPFIDEQKQSNLDYTFNVIENWLNEWI